MSRVYQSAGEYAESEVDGDRGATVRLGGPGAAGLQSRVASTTSDSRQPGAEARSRARSGSPSRTHVSTRVIPAGSATRPTGRRSPPRDLAIQIPSSTSDLEPGIAVAESDQRIPGARKTSSYSFGARLAGDAAAPQHYGDRRRSRASTSSSSSRYYSRLVSRVPHLPPIGGYPAIPDEDLEGTGNAHLIHGQPPPVEEVSSAREMSSGSFMYPPGSGSLGKRSHSRTKEKKESALAESVDPEDGAHSTGGAAAYAGAGSEARTVFPRPVYLGGNRPRNMSNQSSGGSSMLPTAQGLAFPHPMARPDHTYQQPGKQASPVGGMWQYQTSRDSRAPGVTSVRQSSFDEPGMYRVQKRPEYSGTTTGSIGDVTTSRLLQSAMHQHTTMEVQPVDAQNQRVSPPPGIEVPARGDDTAKVAPSPLDQGTRTPAPNGQKRRSSTGSISRGGHLRMPVAQENPGNETPAPTPTGEEHPLASSVVTNADGVGKGWIAAEEDDKSGKESGNGSGGDDDDEKDQAVWGMFQQGRKTEMQHERMLTKLKTSFRNLTLFERSEAKMMLSGHKTCIAHPNSFYRTMWDMWTLLLVLYSAWSIPLIVAFRPEQPLWWVLIEYCIDLMFLMDVLINFRTAYMDTDRHELVEDYNKIMQNYLQGWFVVDVLACIPFEVIVGSMQGSYDPLGGSSGDELAVVGVVKIIRLLRLGRVVKFLNKKVNFAVANVAGAVYLIGVVLFLTHWLACSFAGLQQWYLQNGKRDTWMTETGVYLEPWDTQYTAVFTEVLLAMLRTMTQIPVTNQERVFLIMSVLAGAAMQAVIFGSMAQLIQSLSQSESLYRQRLQMIQERMHYYDLPESLQERILQYMDSMWERHRISDGQSMESFTKKLSEPLQLEVGLWLNRSMVEKVPLFHGTDASVIIFLIRSLKSHLYLPGDYVVRFGEVGDDMFFLRKGLCAIYVLANGDEDDGGASPRAAPARRRRRSRRKSRQRLTDGSYSGTRSFVGSSGQSQMTPKPTGPTDRGTPVANTTLAVTESSPTRGVAPGAHPPPFGGTHEVSGEIEVKPDSKEEQDFRPRGMHGSAEYNPYQHIDGDSVGRAFGRLGNHPPIQAIKERDDGQRLRHRSTQMDVSGDVAGINELPLGAKPGYGGNSPREQAYKSEASSGVKEYSVAYSVHNPADLTIGEGNIEYSASGAVHSIQKSMAAYSREQGVSPLDGDGGVHSSTGRGIARGIARLGAHAERDAAWPGVPYGKQGVAPGSPMVVSAGVGGAHSPEAYGSPSKGRPPAPPGHHRLRELYVASPYQGMTRAASTKELKSSLRNGKKRAPLDSTTSGRALTEPDAAAVIAPSPSALYHTMEARDGSSGDAGGTPGNHESTTSPTRRPFQGRRGAGAPRPSAAKSESAAADADAASRSFAARRTKSMRFASRRASLQGGLLQSMKSTVFGNPVETVASVNREGYPKYHRSRITAKGDREEDKVLFTLKTQIKDGSYFGEVSLLFNVARTASVCAIEHSDMASLSRERFQQLIARFPDLEEQFTESYIKNYLKKNKLPVPDDEDKEESSSEAVGRGSGETVDLDNDGGTESGGGSDDGDDEEALAVDEGSALLLASGESQDVDDDDIIDDEEASLVEGLMSAGNRLDFGMASSYFNALFLPLIAQAVEESPEQYEIMKSLLYQLGPRDGVSVIKSLHRIKSERAMGGSMHSSKASILNADDTSDRRAYGLRATIMELLNGRVWDRLQREEQQSIMGQAAAACNMSVDDAVALLRYNAQPAPNPESDSQAGSLPLPQPSPSTPMTTRHLSNVARPAVASSGTGGSSPATAVALERYMGQDREYSYQSALSGNGSDQGSQHAGAGGLPSVDGAATVRPRTMSSGSSSKGSRSSKQGSDSPQRGGGTQSAAPVSRLRPARAAYHGRLRGEFPDGLSSAELGLQSPALAPQGPPPLGLYQRDAARYLLPRTRSAANTEDYGPLIDQFVPSRQTSIDGSVFESPHRADSGYVDMRQLATQRQGTRERAGSGGGYSASNTSKSSSSYGGKRNAGEVPRVTLGSARSGGSGHGHPLPITQQHLEDRIIQRANEGNELAQLAINFASVASVKLQRQASKQSVLSVKTSGTRKSSRRRRRRDAAKSRKSKASPRRTQTEGVSGAGIGENAIARMRRRIWDAYARLKKKKREAAASPPSAKSSRHASMESPRTGKSKSKSTRRLDYRFPQSTRAGTQRGRKLKRQQSSSTNVPGQGRSRLHPAAPGRIALSTSRPRAGGLGSQPRFELMRSNTAADARVAFTPHTGRTGGKFSFSRHDAAGSISASGTQPAGGVLGHMSRVGSMHDSRVMTQDDQATINSIPIGDAGEDAEPADSGRGTPTHSDQAARYHQSRPPGLGVAALPAYKHSQRSLYLGGLPGHLGRTSSFDAKRGVIPWGKASSSYMTGKPSSTRAQPHRAHFRIKPSTSHGNLASISKLAAAYGPLSDHEHSGSGPGRDLEQQQSQRPRHSQSSSAISGRESRSTSAPGLPPIPYSEAAVYKSGDDIGTPSSSEHPGKIGAAGSGRRRSAASLPSGRGSPGVAAGPTLAREPTSSTVDSRDSGRRPPTYATSPQDEARPLVRVEAYNRTRSMHGSDLSSPQHGSSSGSSSGRGMVSGTSGSSATGSASGGDSAAAHGQASRGEDRSFLGTAERTPASKHSPRSGGGPADLTDRDDLDASTEHDASAMDTSGMSFAVPTPLDARSSKGEEGGDSGPRLGGVQSHRQPTFDRSPPSGRGDSHSGLATLPETRERSGSTAVRQESASREWQRTVDGNVVHGRISKEATEAYERERQVLAERQQEAHVQLGFGSGTTLDTDSGSTNSTTRGPKRTHSSSSTVTDMQQEAQYRQAGDGRPVVDPSRRAQSAGRPLPASPLSKGGHSQSFAGKVEVKPRSVHQVEYPGVRGGDGREPQLPPIQPYMGRRSSEGSVLGLLGSSRGRREQFREAREEVAVSGGVPSALMRGVAAEDEAIIEAAGTSSNAYDAMSDLIRQGKVRRGRRGSLFDDYSVASKSVASGSSSIAAHESYVQATARLAPQSESEEGRLPAMGNVDGRGMPRSLSEGPFMHGGPAMARAGPGFTSEGVSTASEGGAGSPTHSIAGAARSISPETHEKLAGMLLGIFDKVRSTPARLKKNDKLKLGNVKVRLAAMKYLPKEVQKYFQTSVRRNRRYRKQKRQEIYQYLAVFKDTVKKLGRQYVAAKQAMEQSAAAAANREASQPASGAGGEMPVMAETQGPSLKGLLGAGSGRGFGQSGSSGQWGPSHEATPRQDSDGLTAAATASIAGSLSQSPRIDQVLGTPMAGTHPSMASASRPRVTFYPVARQGSARRGSVGQVDVERTRGLLEHDDSDGEQASPRLYPRDRAEHRGTKRGILRMPGSGSGGHRGRSTSSSASSGDIGADADGGGAHTYSPRDQSSRGRVTSGSSHSSPRELQGASAGFIKSIVHQEVSLLSQYQTVALADMRKLIRYQGTAVTESVQQRTSDAVFEAFGHQGIAHAAVRDSVREAVGEVRGGIETYLRAQRDELRTYASRMEQLHSSFTNRFDRLESLLLRLVPAEGTRGGYSVPADSTTSGGRSHGGQTLVDLSLSEPQSSSRPSSGPPSRHYTPRDLLAEGLLVSSTSIEGSVMDLSPDRPRKGEGPFQGVRHEASGDYARGSLHHAQAGRQDSDPSRGAQDGQEQPGLSRPLSRDSDATHDPSMQRVASGQSMSMHPGQPGLPVVVEESAGSGSHASGSATSESPKDSEISPYHGRWPGSGSVIRGSLAPPLQEFESQPLVGTSPDARTVLSVSLAGDTSYGMDSQSFVSTPTSKRGTDEGAQHFGIGIDLEGGLGVGSGGRSVDSGSADGSQVGKGPRRYRSEGVQSSDSGAGGGYMQAHMSLDGRSLRRTRSAQAPQLRASPRDERQVAGLDTIDEESNEDTVASSVRGRKAGVPSAIAVPAESSMRRVASWTSKGLSGSSGSLASGGLTPAITPSGTPTPRSVQLLRNRQTQGGSAQSPYSSGGSRGSRGSGPGSVGSRSSGLPAGAAGRPFQPGSIAHSAAGHDVSASQGPPGGVEEGGSDSAASSPAAALPGGAETGRATASHISRHSRHPTPVDTYLGAVGGGSRYAQQSLTGETPLYTASTDSGASFRSPVNPSALLHTGEAASGRQPFPEKQPPDGGGGGRGHGGATGGNDGGTT